MGNKLYALPGTSKKVQRINLTKKEALSIKDSLKKIETFPISDLSRKGLIRKSGDSQLYNFNINDATRIVISPIKDDKNEDIIYFDIQKDNAKENGVISCIKKIRNLFAQKYKDDDSPEKRQNR